MPMTVLSPALLMLCCAVCVSGCDDGETSSSTERDAGPRAANPGDLDAATDRPDFNAPMPDAARPRPDMQIQRDAMVGVMPDMMIPDRVVPDMDLPDAAPDMALPDMEVPGVPLDGFGRIEGTCGVLTPEVLMSPEPLVVVNRIDFGDDPYDEGDFDLLTNGGQDILEAGNAGGSSEFSELFAFEVLARCEEARLLKTENDIAYRPEPGSITDFLTEIDGLKVGVSVTRAFIFPPDMPYPVERAQDLLNDKLLGVLSSSARVEPEDAWVKQILHVIAYGPMHAESLMTAHSNLNPAITADTIVWITISDGDDDFLY
ncbi:MAG: hypothetical protein ACE366_08790 [Bradymonadia bacterium]